MKSYTAFAIAVLLSAMLAGAAFAGDLDGKTFEVTMTDPGGDAQPDTLIFADGTFDSVECRQYGFSAVPYKAEAKDHDWTFSATATSETEGKSHWTGTVSGNSISGTMHWMKEGQDPITYKFRGKLTP